jgi:hypothetical protein
MIGRYIVERKSSALPLCIRAQNLAVESQNQVHGLKKCGSALLSAWGKKGRHPIPIATALPVLSPRAPGPLPSPPLDPEVRRRGSSKGRAQGAAAAGARVPLLLRVPRRRRSQVLLHTSRGSCAAAEEEARTKERRSCGRQTPSRWEPAGPALGQGERGNRPEPLPTGGPNLKGSR